MIRKRPVLSSLEYALDPTSALVRPFLPQSVCVRLRSNVTRRLITRLRPTPSKSTNADRSGSKFPAGFSVSALVRFRLRTGHRDALRNVFDGRASETAFRTPRVFYTKLSPSVSTDVTRREFQRSSAEMTALIATPAHYVFVFFTTVVEFSSVGHVFLPTAEIGLVNKIHPTALSVNHFNNCL